ncbi:uncharacterized protein [Narcine bancroftii]|uniref:uncharacterized protein n=1 Tax=Narcine bancroftii TaxID=1343680 RepID=UPI003831BA1E
MVFGNKMIAGSISPLAVREGFQHRPSDRAACLLCPNSELFHRRLVRARAASCLLTGQACHRELPVTASQMAGDNLAPDIIAIEHNYCSRRASRRGGQRAGGVGAAQRALSAQRWSCGAAALRSTCQRSHAQSQARIEVDEAVDLVVGIQQAPGWREGAAGIPEQVQSPQQQKEKEALTWNISGPSSEQVGSLRRCNSEPRFLRKSEADKQPLKIHRLSPEEYKMVFSAVVGKALTNTASRPTRRCSLDLARKIKEQLYNAVNRPTFREIIHTDGRVEFIERYSTCSRKQTPPHFELDTSGEPDSEDKASEWAEVAGKNS